MADLEKSSHDVYDQDAGEAVAHVIEVVSTEWEWL